MQRTYDLARGRLAEMEAQRAELDLAIAELKTELDAGAQADGCGSRRLDARKTGLTDQGRKT
jgi:hypothetical protein